MTVRIATGSAERLEASIRSHAAKVAVVGLGYVGLPLLLAASDAGFPAIGFESEAEKVRSLRAGSSYVVDVTDVDVAALNQRGTRFTRDVRSLGTADVIVVAVPTPLTDGAPDLGMVQTAMASVASVLRRGQLVILESTTYPGTTEEMVRPILERSRLVAGRDFFLGYSPERIDPGSGRSFRETPKIVSGLGPADLALVERFYGQLVDVVVSAPRPRDAEMAKLIENTFRQVNIALVNEMATLAPDLGVDIWAAIEAASTKPFGFMPFWPGAGVGGHCIAIDPSYLSWRVGQQLGFGIGFVEHAKEVNNRMPGYVAQRIGEALNEAGKPIRGSRVMVVGVTYKGGVNDVRESPALHVMERLVRSGAELRYHDPYVERATAGRLELVSQPLSHELLESQDCVVILTAHAGIDYRRLIRHAPLIFDATGVTHRLQPCPNVIRL